MKVVSASEMVRAESCAYAAGAVDRDFMESAGEGVANQIQRLTSDWSIEWHAVLLCGSGNNAGDAYVTGCYLLEMGYKVEAFQLTSIDRCSRLCRENYERFVAAGGIVWLIESVEEVAFPESGFFVDAILGTGFHGEVEGLFAEVIERVNGGRLPIFSIDIPSGVSGDHGLDSGPAIVAVATLFLGLPKRGFFLGRAWECVGHLVGVDFGIEEKFLEDAQGDFEMATEHEVSRLLPRVARTRLKYDAGAISAFAGSAAMPGAAILSCFAALRSGAGLVRLVVSEGAEEALASAPPEIIRLPHDHADPLQRVKAVLLGPGLGLDGPVVQRVERLLPTIESPAIFDADLLTLIARHPEWELPRESVLTPHTGEFCRLIGREGEHLRPEERIEAGRDYAEKIEQTVVLKGAPTFIFHPGRRPVVCPAGDPAMATGGTGDVLTGVIAALLAQGLPTWKAAELGVFLHGLAGELAAQKRTVYGVVASDLIEELPAAFRRLAAALTLGRGVVTPTPGFASIGPTN